MSAVLSAANDTCWFSYLTRGIWISAQGRSRDEARIKLLKELQKLELPLPDPKVFDPPDKCPS